MSVLKKKALFTVPISILLIAAIVVSFFLMSIKPDTSKIQQAHKLHEYTKPSVVRILDYAYVDWEYSGTNADVDEYLKSKGYQSVVLGSGSGAIISSDGYIVTNAHVVQYNLMEDVAIATASLELMATEVSRIYGYTFEATWDYMLDYVRYAKVEKGLKVWLPGGDKFSGEIKSAGESIGKDEGKDVAVIKIEGRNHPTLALGDSDKIQNQESIWVAGYPAAAESDILSADSILVSTMNDGKISATSKKTEHGSPVIQINAAATHGNSGGPVINEKGEIIGLLTFRGDTVNGQEVQGFNFAVPVNTVHEFVAQSGASKKKSDTDTLYKEGLTLFWGGYYKNALDKFEAVQRIYPNHSEIKRYITESEENAGKSKTLWSDYKTVFYILDGVAGLLVIVLMIFTFVVKPKQPVQVVQAVQQMQPIQYTQPSVQPVLPSQPVQQIPQVQPTPPVQPMQTSEPTQPLSVENLITDLNKDGKIDIQDILLALQEQQKKQNNNDQ
ncbi:S1C family serine protease [Pseudoneobacillus sp. C159]